MNALGGLRSAFAYFSILPVGANRAPDADALAWLPLVGALVGGVAGLAGEVVARTSTHALGVATAFTLSLLLSGAIHLDGFLDGCDAFFASVPPSRRMEILKDPRHGTFALAGFAVVGISWSAALWSLDAGAYPVGLAMSASVARWSAIMHALYVPYAGATTTAFASRPSSVTLALGLMLCVALAWPLGGHGIIAALVGAASATVSVAFARRRLGGVLVGDAYGFAIVVADVATLLALVA